MMINGGKYCLTQHIIQNEYRAGLIPAFLT
ncbi:hypothetical protein RJ142_CDS0002 [Klebsiella phage EKq1]|uniref:Uncharacterized protein n=1 Tax=Klebsiella phage PMBT64 TaxID=3229740 RepID=A0AB39C3C9_9CAUD|nr:hypothetical protein RJ142_CDS0002 [Klebsiella phage EKq1]